MKKLIFSILLAASCQVIWAQGDIDALRYSQNELGSTARSMGTGGAFGALGADLSSTQINPAGLAVYRNNNFTLGAGMLNAKSKTTYLDKTKKDFDFSMQVPGIGFVFYNGKYENRQPAKTGWINTNVAISMNRTNNFSGIINYSGLNTNNSMLDYFAERANGLTIDDLSASSNELQYGYNDLETMFWDAYLIDSVGNRTYAAAIDNLDRDLTQKNILSTKGSMNDINFSLASNYENKLYIGGGVTLTTVRYKEENRFTEIDESTNYNNWSSWSLEQDLLTKGIGFSANLGLIFRANDNVRFGASLKTPTLYNLKDEYSDKLNVEFDNGSYGTYKSSDGYYNYKLISPMISTLSAAYLFGKNGFVSADAEIVDYSTMRLRPTINAFEIANETISEKYDKAVNLRIGGEYVYKMLRFRGGFANYASPLASGSDRNLARTYVTTGIGIKDKNWGLDVALVQKFQKQTIQPYTLNSGIVPVATSNLGNNTIVVTLSTVF
ncbi:MAG: hypothetical protein H6607_07595 [Flavobacteriales bacterium]|nr:hypothetical protein [Flavobacteriales bacterium]